MFDNYLRPSIFYVTQYSCTYYIVIYAYQHRSLIIYVFIVAWYSKRTHTTTKGRHKFHVRCKSFHYTKYSFITYDDDDGARTEWSRCRQTFYLRCIMSKCEYVKSLYRPRNIQQYYLDIYNMLLYLWFPNCAPQGYF